MTVVFSDLIQYDIDKNDILIFQTTNNMNDTDMPTASTTLPEHQQTLVDEAEPELMSQPTLV